MKNKTALLQALISKDKSKIKSLVSATRLSKHYLFIEGKEGITYYKDDNKIVLTQLEMEELIRKESKSFNLTIIKLPDNGR